ncbi:MAG TPA: DMT family transporter [Amycolatopsis sp.]|uniref:DMT family transporter n=1 Tax=Amycolatopsis nalaikhensis TaxID=715472 RepID=A0ABY8X9Y2_9PSEU|nr:DMT family transporter [Amycolatopsis sp. 2-2]WIV53112.1 DMT family transporter [Amycolatopsis sp. 2-2]
MNATALSLVLVAAVVHAAWNLAAKRVSSGGTQFVWLYYTASAVLLLPVTVVLLLIEPVRPQWSWLLAAVVTSILHIAYGVVLQRGYRVGDLSVVYPVARGTGPLLSVLAAVLVLGERPGPLGLVGAFLVVAGVLVISTGRTAADPHAVKAGIVYGLLTGAVIAGYTLWDAHSVTGIGVPPLVYFGLGSILQSLMLVPGALADRGEVKRLWREQRREVLLVAVLSPIAYILVLYALTMAPVSLVAPARELSIVLGGLAAWLVLGESDAVRRLAGSVIVLSGIAAIAAA